MFDVAKEMGLGNMMNPSTDRQVCREHCVPIDSIVYQTATQAQAMSIWIMGIFSSENDADSVDDLLPQSKG